LIACIESAKGLTNTREIATSHPSLTSLFAAEDTGTGTGNVPLR
jgi:citrate lyase beta subunit